MSQGKPGKYTQYSHATGVTKTNQSTLDQVVEPSVQEHEKLQQDKSVLFVQNFGNLANEIAEFSEARAWTQFHTPRNIILALLGEVGELAELVQWKGDNEDEDANANVTFTEQELDKMGQELADVTIYLLRLTFVCQLVEPVQTSLQDSLSVLEE
jgi:NTP pyrophosphatase (non-canonical NTP hydrolase)